MRMVLRTTCVNWSNMQEVIDKLRKFTSPTPDKWREEADWRRENKTWLRYSQRIAMMMLDKMDSEKINQRQLAERMGCSQQYVSKVLRGRENLSLETLIKIQSALDIEILKLW